MGWMGWVGIMGMMSMSMHVVMAMMIMIVSMVGMVKEMMTSFGVICVTSFTSVPGVGDEWNLDVFIIGTGVFTMFHLVSRISNIEGIILIGSPALGNHNVEWSVGSDCVTVSIGQLQVVNIWATSEWRHVPGGSFDKAVVSSGAGHIGTIALADWNASLDLLERVAPLPSVGSRIVISTALSMMMVTVVMMPAVMESSKVTMSMQVGNQVMEVERAAGEGAARMMATGVMMGRGVMGMGWHMMMMVMMVVGWSMMMVMVMVMVGRSMVMVIMVIMMIVVMMMMVVVMLVMMWQIMVMMPSRVCYIVVRQELNCTIPIGTNIAFWNIAYWSW